MTQLKDIIGQDLGLYKKNINYRRHYVLPGQEQSPLVSVTSIVSDVISKPALVNWGKNIGIKAGQKTLEDIKGVFIDEDIIEKFPLNARSHLNTLSLEAADYGTEAHSLIEKIIEGYDPDIPQEFRSVIDSFNIWKSTTSLDLTMAETQVYSLTLGVAGTMDALALRGEEAVILDWKTGKGIYDDYSLQTGGYINCLEEMTGRKINEAWIIRLGKEFPDFEARQVNVEEAREGFIQAKKFWDVLKGGNLWI